MSALPIQRLAAAAVLAASASLLVHPAGARDGAYIPPTEGTWQTRSALSAGFDADRLAAALEFAFARNSSSVVVVHDGRLVSERHAALTEARRRYLNLVQEPTAEGRPVEDVASVQKVVVSLLVGVARERKLLELDQPVTDVLGPGWSRSPKSEAQITLRHLLQMTSGLTPSLSFESRPGAGWRYNTNAYAKLVPVLERLTQQPLSELTAEWLTIPLGMQHSGWTKRPWVAADADANKVGFTTSARDLARLGLLVLRQGRWAGDQVVPGDWVEDSTRTSQQHNPAYGLLWWVNAELASSGHAGQEPQQPKMRFPNAPDDLFAALGALGRRIYVVPSLELVITRLGDAPGDDFDAEFWRRLMAART